MLNYATVWKAREYSQQNNTSENNKNLSHRDSYAYLLFISNSFKKPDGFFFIFILLLLRAIWRKIFTKRAVYEKEMLRFG